jgi:hypothetical protein
MSAPQPGSTPLYPVAWGKRYDPPQGGGWITPSGEWVPYPPRAKDRPRP